MQLTDKDITTFQAIYEKEFGEKISREDALEKGIRLLRFMSLVYESVEENDPCVI